jgi:hypothetical protein
MSESKLQERIFGSKREETTEEWRKLHFEELDYLCLVLVG